MLNTHKVFVASAILAALALAGCGSSSGPSGGASSVGASGGGSPPRASSSGSAAAALSADARSAATGDIPDNQVFLVFHDHRAGYSMKYPEGWTEVGTGVSVTFEDKNNLVRVTVTHGWAPTPSAVSAQLQALKRSNPTLAFHPPVTVKVGSSRAVKAVYTTESARNAVTGKRVLLVVDRYELSHAGKLAVVDLGTPKGVDNVDAYRLMIQSFRWQ